MTFLEFVEILAWAVGGLVGLFLLIFVGLISGSPPLDLDGNYPDEDL